MSTPTVNNGYTVWTGLDDTVYIDLDPADLTASVGCEVWLSRPTSAASVEVFPATIVDADTVALTVDAAFHARVGVGRWNVLVVPLTMIGTQVPYPNRQAGRIVLTVADVSAP